MTATVTRTPATAPRTRRDRRRLAVTRQYVRLVRTGALVVGAAFGGSAWATATAYANTYPTEQARREAAAAVGGMAGLRTLLGPVQDIGTVGGYLVYKNFVFLTLVGGIWAVLAATRLLRGEEDAGRRQLVLAGATTPARVAASALGALVLAVAVVLGATTALTLLAARDPALGLGGEETVLYAASLAVSPLVFAAVGALLSQLARARRVATVLSLLVMAVAFVVRMAGDSRDGLHWLLWATPFGWTELVRPYTAPDPRPLLVAVATAIGLGGAAVALAGRRDVGAGMLTFRESRAPRLRGLGSPLGLAVRQEGPALLSWCVGALAAGLVFGLFAQLTRGDVPDSLRESLGRYGARGDITNQFLAVVFLVVATVVALLPAGQIGAAAAEETSGRLVPVLAGPVRRSTWLAGRLALATGGVVAAGLLGGLGVWLGARSQGLSLGLAGLLGAGLNVVPTALLALGAGALALALAPRVAGATVYALVGWSVFADLVGPLVGGGETVSRISLLHWMALVPADDADPVAIVISLAVATLLMVTAGAVFSRRGLRPA